MVLSGFERIKELGLMVMNKIKDPPNTLLGTCFKS
jgi:hypothetical protein